MLSCILFNRSPTPLGLLLGSCVALIISSLIVTTMRLHVKIDCTHWISEVVCMCVRYWQNHLYRTISFETYLFSVPSLRYYRALSFLLGNQLALCEGFFSSDSSFCSLLNNINFIKDQLFCTIYPCFEIFFICVIYENN